MPNNIQNRIQKLEQELASLRDTYYSNNFNASQDFNKYSRFNNRLRVPALDSAPPTCEIGELYVNAGNGKLYVCSAANTWTIVGTQS